MPMIDHRDPILDQLRDELRVDESPTFVANVRARVASEIPSRSRWFVPPPIAWAAAAVMVLGAVLVLERGRAAPRLTNRSATDAPVAETRALALNRPEPVGDALAAVRNPRMTQRSEPLDESGSRREVVSVRGRAVALAGPPADVMRDVLVPKDQAAGLNQLLADLAAGKPVPQQTLPARDPDTGALLPLPPPVPITFAVLNSDRDFHPGDVSQ